MAKLNPCFKKIFVFFNIIFAILGVLILGLGLVAHFTLPEDEHKFSGVITLVIVGAVVFILSVLGAYGAQKESKNVLIAFFVIMCVGTVILLRIAVPLATSRAEVTQLVQREFQLSVPLKNTNPEFQHAVEFLQEQASCCGMFNGYQDWGSDVPASCDCTNVDPGQCQMMSEQKTANNFADYMLKTDNRRVNKQPCGPILMEYVNTVLNIALGLFFGFGSLALLAAVMSLVMIIRISAPTTTSPPPIFSLNYQPPKYSELIPTA